MMARHTSEAPKLRKQLDDQLATLNRQTGRNQVWAATELAVLDMIVSQTDRKVELEKLYESTDDASEKVKISAEVRLLDAATERMLRKLNEAMPKPQATGSRRSEKARAAANSRWQMEDRRDRAN
jgi:hypothetical protein